MIFYHVIAHVQVPFAHMTLLLSLRSILFTIRLFRAHVAPPLDWPAAKPRPILCLLNPITIELAKTVSSLKRFQHGHGMLGTVYVGSC
jgi:hypothetical protein